MSRLLNSKFLIWNERLVPENSQRRQTFVIYRSLSACSSKLNQSLKGQQLSEEETTTKRWEAANVADCTVWRATENRHYRIALNSNSRIKVDEKLTLSGSFYGASEGPPWETKNLLLCSTSVASNIGAEFSAHLRVIDCWLSATIYNIPFFWTVLSITMGVMETHWKTIANTQWNGYGT